MGYLFSEGSQLALKLAFFFFLALSSSVAPKSSKAFLSFSLVFFLSLMLKFVRRTSWQRPCRPSGVCVCVSVFLDVDCRLRKINSARADGPLEGSS